MQQLGSGRPVCVSSGHLQLPDDRDALAGQHRQGKLFGKAVAKSH